MARPKPGPGRRAGLMLGDVTAASWQPGSPRAIQLVSWEATHSLHAPSEDCFGASGPPRAALFGLSVGQQVQPIPSPGWGRQGHGYTQARARKRGGADARGREPRPHGGRGPQAQSSLSRGKQPTVFTLPQKTVLGRVDPHSLPSLRLESASRYSLSHPRAGAARGVSRPKPGPGRGAGLMLGDVSPGHMAAGVPTHNPACLLGSNPQSSRSLGRLFRGGRTPKRGPLWA